MTSPPSPAPSGPRIGGLFFGYGGLDLAVQSVIPDAELAWYSEVDKGANKIAAHRFPDVPNHGDITAIDWATVEPVDILTGGSPCQDLSHAGRRAGMTEGTRSNLWVAMREAIAQLRPGLVVWENVRGAFSAAADSEVEPCAGCVGDGSGVHLRALGRVLGDLSDLGYDCRWHGIRASDVGAPHGRFRVFVAAYPAGNAGRIQHGDRALAAVPAGSGSRPPGQDVDEPRRPGGASGSRQRTLLPTPRTSDTNGAGAHGEGGIDLRTAVSLLPTPSVADVQGGRKSRSGDRSNELLLNGIAHQRRWGEYAAAIARWEGGTRPAPDPTTQGRSGPQLSARFAEWMMGLAAGWVADVPGITRNEALKALGNGVVPQQAAAALREMFAWEVAA